MVRVREDYRFLKNVLLIAGPVILQQIINLSVNLCDGIMVGQLQEAAISGVSIGNQFYIIFQIFCMGLGGGAAVLVNQFWGKNDSKSIKKVISVMLRIGIAVAVIFSFASLFATDSIMNIYTNNSVIIREGSAYLSMMAFAFLLHGVGLTLTIVYRSVGVVWLALVSSVFSFGLNIFLNWVFIFGHLGFSPMGVRGAALGTVIARALEFVIIVYYVFFVDKKVSYKLKDIVSDSKSIMKEFIKFSLPVIISDLMLQLGNNIITIIMGHMENQETMLAANNITMVTVQVSTFFILGLSNAASIMTGNSIGKGKIKTARAYGKKFLVLSIIVGFIAAILIRIISPFVTAAYDISEATIQCTQSLVEAITIIIVFQSVSSVLTKGVLRGGGDTRFLMVADVLFLWIASVPLGYLFGITINASSFWVYFMVKIDMIIKAFWCIIRLYRGKWIHVVELRKN